MDSQPPAMLHYVCQWTPTKWKQLQQLHAATNQIHEVLMIWLGRDKIHSTNTLNIWRMSLCTLTRIVVWRARRLDQFLWVWKLFGIENSKKNSKTTFCTIHCLIYYFLLWIVFHSWVCAFLRALHFGSNDAYKSVLTQYFKIYVLYYLCAARLELAVTFCFVASQLSRRQSPCF